MRRIVVFPLPLGPVRARSVPSETSRETSSVIAPDIPCIGRLIANVKPFTTIASDVNDG